MCLIVYSRCPDVYIYIYTHTCGGFPKLGVRFFGVVRVVAVKIIVFESK